MEQAKKNRAITGMKARENNPQRYDFRFVIKCTGTTEKAEDVVRFRQ